MDLARLQSMASEARELMHANARALLNVNTPRGSFPIEAAGALLGGAGVIDELLSAIVDLTNAFETAQRARPAPAAPRQPRLVATTDAAPAAGCKRHKFVDGVCTVCGKEKGAGGRPAKAEGERAGASATDPVFAEKADGPSSEPLPGVAAPAKPKVLGDKVADAFVGGPV